MLLSLNTESSSMGCRADPPSPSRRARAYMYVRAAPNSNRICIQRNRAELEPIQRHPEITTGPTGRRLLTRCHWADWQVLVRKATCLYCAFLRGVQWCSCIACSVGFVNKQVVCVCVHVCVCAYVCVCALCVCFVRVLCACALCVCFVCVRCVLCVLCVLCVSVFDEYSRCL